MNEISFTVLGNPKALKRHRTYSHDRFGQPLVTPIRIDPSAGAKDTFLILAMNNAPRQPLDEPLTVEVKFYFQRPKNHYKSKKGLLVLKNSAAIYHKSTPDLDNLIKLILDALNGIFWRDDSIISRLVSEKLYSASPRTEIKISTLLDGEENG